MKHILHFFVLSSVLLLGWDALAKSKAGPLLRAAEKKIEQSKFVGAHKKCLGLKNRFKSVFGREDLFRRYECAIVGLKSFHMNLNRHLASTTDQSSRIRYRDEFISHNQIHEDWKGHTAHNEGLEYQEVVSLVKERNQVFSNNPNPRG